MRRKSEKFLKTVLDLTQFVQNVFFATRMSREHVAKSSHQNPMWQILKNISKCFSWLEGPLASKSRSILSKLATRASTPAAKLSHKNAKNPKILKFF